MYKVIWKDEAEESLNKLDKKTAQKIFDKIEKYLAHDPYAEENPWLVNIKAFIVIDLVIIGLFTR